MKRDLLHVKDNAQSRVVLDLFGQGLAKGSRR